MNLTGFKTLGFETCCEQGAELGVSVCPGCEVWLNQPMESEMREIPMIRESSQIEKIEYDAKEEKLKITFKRGGIYVYDKVPDRVAIELANADSIGSYFSEAIKKGGYNFTKL